MLRLLAVIFFLSAPVFADDGNWVKAWNEAEFNFDIPRMEAAYHASDPDSYISISHYALGAAFANRLDWLHPFASERQYMAFALSRNYLNQFQAKRTPDNLEAFLVSVRRLAQVSGSSPWIATKLMIARARELESFQQTGRYDYDIGYWADQGGIPIPNGADEWLFYIQGGPVITDISREYDQEWRHSSRKVSIFSSPCVLVFPLCWFTLRFKDESTIGDMRFPISLNVRFKGKDIDYTRLKALIERERLRVQREVEAE